MVCKVLQCTAGRKPGPVLCLPVSAHKTSLPASPHTPLRRACLSRSGALLAAQASLTALPDELLGSILRRACPDKAAASRLACVCRRWRELLRAPPLPLALDFSAWPLTMAQCRWLLEPAQAGRVEAAIFFVVGGSSADPLWQQPLLDTFLARHGGTLLHLSGVPLRLVASLSQQERPALDLRGLRLTKLGIDCYDIDKLLRRKIKCLWLWPECLPGALEELELLGLYGEQLGSLAWAPHSRAGLAERLPRLQTLRLKCRRWERLIADNVPLLEGQLAFEVVEGRQVRISAALFERVRYIRVVAYDYVRILGDGESVADFVDRLCSAGLQAAELRAEGRVCLGPTRNPRDPEVVRELISESGGRFAVEVGVPGQPADGVNWRNADLRRLAWRGWPATHAPGLPAAIAAHERARAWAEDE